VSNGKRAYRRWTDTEAGQLRDLYGQIPTAEIARRLGRGEGYIYGRLIKDGLATPKPRRHRSYNPYFQVIDSPVKAYVLGLLAADGWVDDEGHIGIELDEKDQAAVALVRDELCPTGSVRFYYRRDRGYAMARFQVGSVQMARDLAGYGIVPRKTHTLAWPEGLPAEFDNSFVCGYFDGDGHLRWDQYPYWTVICASRPFVETMREHIEAALGVGPFGPYRQGSAWSITKAGKAAAAIEAWMHRDVAGLARKRLPDDVRARYL
jgi:hypothetical protein